MNTPMGLTTVVDQELTVEKSDAPILIDEIQGATITSLDNASPMMKNVMEGNMSITITALTITIVLVIYIIT